MDSMAATKEKWGVAAAAAGFTIIPNHLLAINQYVPKERRLSPTEFFVIAQVLSAWWSADRLPFPSKATLARRTGLSSRQVQRALASLEAKGYIERVARYSTSSGRTSNVFDLDGLSKIVREVASLHPQDFKKIKRADGE